MRKLTLIPLAMLTLLLLPRPTPGGDNAIDDLSDRLTLLEKATLRDTSHPNDTHAARLERLEKALDAGSKATEISEKSIATLQREVKALTRRLTDFEKQTPARPDNAGNELRDLEKQLAEQERALNELSSRIKKLESVVKP